MKSLILKVLFLLTALSCCPLCSNDILDLNRIYNDTFSYSLPRPIIESYLSGKAFDKKDFYTPEQQENLKGDIKEIYATLMEKIPLQKPLAVMTAGGPGAGKTLLMRKLLADAKAQGINYGYIDPDDVCLKSQTRTYLADLKTCEGTKEARQALYNEWRPGSNAACHIILANLIRDKYAFYFGTTSTGPVTGKFWAFLKAQGYNIHCIHVSAPDDVRWGSIVERDKTFVQTTEEDVEKKANCSHKGSWILILPMGIKSTFIIETE